MPTQLDESISAANVITALQEGATPGQLIREANVVLGDFTECTVINRGRTYGRCVLLSGDNRILFASTGISSQVQGGEFFFGYGNPGLMRRELGFNFRVAQDVHDDLVPAWSGLFRNQRHFSAYGHSAGGVVAECFAKVVALSRRQIVDQIITYGAPKPGYPSAAWEGPETNRRRWMNRDDPVPTVPYARLSPADTISLVILGQAGEPYAMGHGSGGTLLYSDGRAVTALDVTGDMDPAGVGLQVWLAGLDGGALGPHSITEYWRRLTALRGLINEQMEMPAGGFPTIPPEPNFVVPFPAPTPSPPGQTNPVGVINNGRFHYRNMDSVPAIPTGDSTVGMSKIEPHLLMKRVTVAGVYYVVWNDFLVGKFPTASSAKTFAGAGNRWLRKMGTSTNISGSVLTDALSSFLTIASQPGQGVKPPINVV